MGLWAKRDDMVVHEEEPHNAEPPRHALADRALTPVDSFNGRNHSPIPTVDTYRWRLTVDGLVEHPRSLQDLEERFEPRTSWPRCSAQGTAGPG